MLRSYPSVRRVILFGSTARGAFGAGSDIDLAVEGLEPASFFRAWLEVEEAAGGLPFDLVDLNDASAPLRATIEREGVVLFARR